MIEFLLGILQATWDILKDASVFLLLRFSARRGPGSAGSPRPDEETCWNRQSEISVLGLSPGPPAASLLLWRSANGARATSARRDTGRNGCEYYRDHRDRGR